MTYSRSYITCQWQYHNWTILLQHCFIHTALLHPKTAAAPGPLLPSSPYLILLRDTSVLCSVNHNIPVVFYSLSVMGQFYYRSLNYPAWTTIYLFLSAVLAFDPHLTFQPCQCFKAFRHLKCRDNSDSWGKSSRISPRPACWSPFSKCRWLEIRSLHWSLQSHLNQSLKNTNSCHFRPLIPILAVHKILFSSFFCSFNQKSIVQRCR